MEHEGCQLEGSQKTCFFTKNVSMFGTLTTEEMDQLLTRQLMGRLGCNAFGRTYVIPISYAYRDGAIYCYTMEGLKLSMLRENKKVCFQVDDSKDLSNWQSVICWGEFEELTSDADRTEALAVLNARHLPVRTSMKMQINKDWPYGEKGSEMINGIFFRINIEDKTGRCETAETSTNYAS